MARRIKGGMKRRETDPASNQFPKCSPLSGTHKEIHRVGQRREGGGRNTAKQYQGRVWGALAGLYFSGCSAGTV